MLDRLSEVILPRIIGLMVHKREVLTPKERRAQESFMAKLNISKRKTKHPLVVAIVGLVGSGKSSVAEELAGEIGATIIEGDEIRVHLRKEGERYEGARKIAENAVREIIQRGGNVILDSDHVDAKKRASLREKVRKASARLIFIRTYADFDVMTGRIITATYRDHVEDFFGGANTKWEGTAESKGAVVKMRELWRRTPYHYRWVNQGGGRWVLKKLPFATFAEIDTTDPKHWKAEVQKTARKLLTL